MNRDKFVVIIGAGPAGLTAAFELKKAEVRYLVLEKDEVVGGISRTVNHKDYLFDIGGHRFFTKVKAVDDMWHNVLSDHDFLRRPRLSRIYYNKNFFYYPLKPLNALSGLGIWNSCLILVSYIKAQLFPIKPEATFEQWVTNRFGKRLYQAFFKTYTEKVWGIPCTEISAEWATQRIKGLSLLTALKNALIQKQLVNKNKVIKTLIDSFDYPRRGPGMMWERVFEMVNKEGGQVRLSTAVERIYWTEGKVEALGIETKGRKQHVPGTHFLSSMPIRDLIQKFDPPVPQEVLQAAERLSYRDFLTVALIIDKKEVFPDNWIYIHDPEVKVGRIQNFKNWSPEMVPDPKKTCLGLEYFCFEGDGLWTMADQDLVALGRKELAMLGLVREDEVVDGTVVRMAKAYPVYDSTYRQALQVVCQFLNCVPNLGLIGRNGMHKYNNQDHSMLTAMLAVKNILGGNYDLWQVNTDQEYHEEVTSHQAKQKDDLTLVDSTQPLVPRRVSMQNNRRES